MNLEHLFRHLAQFELHVLERLNLLEKRIMSELDTLKAAVAAEDTEIGSAITLLNGLKAKLDDAIASNDPAALKALSDDIGAQTQALAAAVTANTPADPGTGSAATGG